MLVGLLGPASVLASEPLKELELARPGRAQTAQPFEVATPEGGKLSLADYRGRVVLLNFWATWCKPCEEEMPAMERLHAKLGGPDFELVAVSVDEGDDEVRAFRDRLGLGFPILRDPDKQAADAYQTFRFPESWLIGRDGNVVARYIGPRDWDGPTYTERIRKLIAAK